MQRVFSICLFAFLAVAIGPAAAAPLTPAVHGDFGHYTFALTWQPGFCATDGGCLADQPKAALIGLHGLWASRPKTLIDRGVVPQQWWGKGCDYFGRSEAAPSLNATVQGQLDAVMPHIAHSLLTHEYDKHVRCFGFDPNQFFATELAMRAAVVDGAFGRYLLGLAGTKVAHADVIAAFKKDFSTDLTTSLQLQCDKDAHGHPILTQFWMTLRTDKLAAFPGADSLMATPASQYEDTCPATFRVPAW
jgi:ribonuclease I